MLEKMPIAPTPPLLAAVIAAAQVTAELVHLPFSRILALGSEVWQVESAQLLSGTPKLLGVVTYSFFPLDALAACAPWLSKKRLLRNVKIRIRKQ